MVLIDWMPAPTDTSSYWSFTALNASPAWLWLGRSTIYYTVVVGTCRLAGVHVNGEAGLRHGGAAPVSA